MDSALDAGKTVAASTETRPPEGRSGGIEWAPIIWFAALLLVSYVAVLYALGVQWTQDDDVSHGPFVPAVAAYIAWQRRKEFIETPKQPNYWGLAVVGWAIFQLLIATLRPDF